MIRENTPAPAETFSVPFMQSVPVHLHRPAQPDGSVVVALHGQGMRPESFARELVTLTGERGPEIDDVIQSASRNSHAR